MKSLKMFGLATVAAVAAATFVGAGPASATTLCKVTTNPCPAGFSWGANAKVVAHSTEAVITGSSLGVSCESTVTFLAATNDGVGAALLGKITALAWTNCTGCSPVTTTLLPSASLQGSTLTADKIELELKGCSGFLVCKATAKDAALTFSGGTIGSMAAFKASNVPVAVSGLACGTAATWNAGGGSGGLPYVVTSVNGVTSGNVFVVASP